MGSSRLSQFTDGDCIVNISVAICTWNRAALLDKTLSRMHAVRVPTGTSWELLVVDNSSTDDTDAVIDRHCQHLPLRKLYEPKQGHSNARNCAIEHATGDLLVWTDDDVLVEPDWLTEYAAAAAAFPNAGYFGGTVDPWFETDPPPWLARHLPQLEAAYALRRLGSDVRLLADGERVFGANMAFRTAVMRTVRFDPRLGRVGEGMLSGDETDVIERLRAAGYAGVWVGTARVKHFIPTDRMTTDYLWRYLVGGERTQIRMDGAAADAPPPRAVSRWARRHYVLESAKERVLAAGKGERWLGSFRRAAWLRALIDENTAATEGTA